MNTTRTLDQKILDTYIGYSKKMGIEAIHIHKPHDLEDIGHYLNGIIYAKAGEEKNRDTGESVSILVSLVVS